MGKIDKESVTGHSSNKNARVVWLLSTWALVATCIAVYSTFDLFGFKSPRPVEKYSYRQENAVEDITNDQTDKHQDTRPTKKNVIFMVSDGMGPASLSLTRSFKQLRDELNIDDILSLDKHFIGHSRTRSSDTLITDSAAGATAFSCGKKSYNGAIGVTPDQLPCGTLLEAAKLQGFLTGLVVTTRITDATPASFSAHAHYRSEEDLIAQHQLGEYPLGRMVDLIIGGGRCHYMSSELGGCRQDGRNLVQEAVENGWTYVENRQDYDKLGNGENVSLPLLALLASNDIPYDIDRDDSVYPSLESTAKTALRALGKATEDSDQGFFLLIEGSRIDHAGHSNDPAAQVREVLAYDDAFKAAIEFAQNSEVDTIVLSTSDHETGGLAVGRQVSSSYPDYIWYPQVLLEVQRSAEYLAKELRDFQGHKDDLKNFIKSEILIKGLGIDDYSKQEVRNLIKHKNNAHDDLVEMVSTRSETGWSTHGHTAVDVNLYGYSANPITFDNILKTLGGSNENTDIGNFMAAYMSLDLENITKILQDDLKQEAFTLDEDYDEPLDEYHEGMI